MSLLRKGTSWRLPLLILLSAVACRSEQPAPAAPESVRDIVLITIDTWRADAAGFAGNTGVETPQLDTWARRGLRFTNAHAHNVVTLPSHVNILTGLLPYEHGVRDNAGFVLDPKHATVAPALRSNGFTTGAFVAAYPLDRRFGLSPGFDVYDDNYGKGSDSTEFVVQERPAAEVLRSAASWWRSREGQKRFMWVHLYDPHAPYVPSYLGEVAAVDRSLREILSPILGEKTVVIVTADHGEALGDHGELTHGLFAYEATLKVPMIVSGPGIKPRVLHDYVQHIDIAPTILELAGIDPPRALKGQSLLGAIGERETYFESLSTSLNRGWAPLTGVIRGGLKYIDLPLPELYALPDEVQNLAAAQRRDVDAARKILASVLTVPAARTISTEEAARLRSLGYITGSGDARSSYTAEDDPKTLITLDAKMHEVVDAYQRGESARALTLAREVVAARPEMAAGRELLAFTLQQSERIPDAIRELQRIVATGRGTDEVRSQLGLLLSESGRTDEAISILQPVARPGNPKALNAYGVALADRGDLAGAVAQFETILRDDPANAPALQNIGIVILRKGEVVRAKEYLARALELNGRLPLTLNTLGVIAAREGDLVRAVELWRRAVVLDSRQYDALYNIALVEVRAGRAEQARKALEQFVRTAPPSRYGREIADARKALERL